MPLTDNPESGPREETWTAMPTTLRRGPASVDELAAALRLAPGELDVVMREVGREVAT